MAYITKQHQAVLRCLEARPEEAVTAAALAEALRRQGQSVGLSTVYRQLERLASEGLIHRVPAEEGALYQCCPHPPVRGCFLLRCGRCGRVDHLDCGHLEDLTRHIAQAHGFRVDPRQTVLTGLCLRCEGREGEEAAKDGRS